MSSVRRIRRISSTVSSVSTLRSSTIGSCIGNGKQMAHLYVQCRCGHSWDSHSGALYRCEVPECACRRFNCLQETIETQRGRLRNFLCTSSIATVLGGGFLWLCLNGRVNDRGDWVLYILLVLGAAILLALLALVFVGIWHLSKMICGALQTMFQ